MFGLGTTELMIILVIVIIVFGAKRIPLLGKGLGQGIKDFRKALSGAEDEDGEDSGSVNDENKSDNA